MQVSNKEIESVQRLPPDTRYEYFIKKVADFGEAWGLYSEGWATTSDPKGKNLIPLWPAKAYAAANCTGEWKQFSPKRVSVDELLDDFGPDAHEKHYAPSVFFVNGVGGVAVGWDKLCEDLRAELAKY